MIKVHPNNGNATKSMVEMRDYVDLLYQEEKEDLVQLKELLCVKIEALDKATSLAKENMDLRMINTNEWRNTINDIIALLARREQLEKLEIIVSQLEISMEKLFARKETVDKMDGRIGILENSKSYLEGRASQASVYVAYAFSAIGIIMGLISILSGK